MPKKTTMSDIAAKLGISTVTVSKALSGQKGVSEEMRQKIIALAEKTGYQKSFGIKQKVDMDEMAKRILKKILKNLRGEQYKGGVSIVEGYLIERDSVRSI